VVIGGDVHLIQQELPVLDAAPGVLQIQVARPDGFDLRAHKLNTRLKFFLHEIFVIGFPIPGHDLDPSLFQTAHLPTEIHGYIIS